MGGSPEIRVRLQVLHGIDYYNSSAITNMNIFVSALTLARCRVRSSKFIPNFKLSRKISFFFQIFRRGGFSEPVV